MAKLDDWLINVETVLSNIQVQQDQAAVFGALKSGSAALKELQSQAPLEEVERLLEETEEAKRYQQEVAELMAGQLTPEEDAAATAELMALEDELFPEAAAEPKQEEAKVEHKTEALEDAAVELPDVPTKAPALAQKRQTSEAREMEEPLPA